MVTTFLFLLITLLFSVLSEGSGADGEGMRTLASLCFDGISPDPREDRVSGWEVIPCIGSIDFLYFRPGDEGSDPVRSIQFPAVETSDEPPKPSIETFLLYRPGHYDILYQSQGELE